MGRLRKIYHYIANRIRAVGMLGNFLIVIAYAFSFFGSFFVFQSSTLRTMLLIGAAIGAVVSYGITASLYKGAGRKRNALRSVRYLWCWGASLILFAATMASADAQVARRFTIIRPLFEVFVTAPIVLDILVLLEGVLAMYLLVGAITLSAPAVSSGKG